MEKPTRHLLLFAVAVTALAMGAGRLADVPGAHAQTASASYFVASASAQPVGSTQPFFSTTFGVFYVAGQVVLANHADGTGSIAVDDVLNVSVLGGDGVTRTYSHDFSGGCSGTITPIQPDLTNLFRLGNNQVTISFSDKCGFDEGNWETWLVVFPPPPPPPLATPTLSQPQCETFSVPAGPYEAFIWSWSTVPDAARYHLQMSTTSGARNPDGSLVSPDTVQGLGNFFISGQTSYTFGPIAPGTYYGVVRAESSFGSNVPASSWSNEVTVTCQLPGATKLAFTYLPTVAQAGNSFAVQVRLEDNAGHFVAQSGVAVTIQITLANGGITEQALCTPLGSQPTDSSGTVFFSCSVNQSGNYAIRAFASGLSPTSSPLSVVSPAGISHQQKLDALDEAERLSAQLGIGLVPVAGTGASCFLFDAAGGAKAYWVCVAKGVGPWHYFFDIKDILRIQADERIAADPPDPNFTAIAQPTPMAAVYASTSDGFSPAEVDAINRLVDNEVLETALQQALVTSVERAQGAAAAGNIEWLMKQNQAVASYASWLSSLFAHEIQLRANLLTAFQVAGESLMPITTADVQTLQASLASGGLPPALLQLLTAAGVPSGFPAVVQQLITSFDGTNIPSATTALQQAAQDALSLANSLTIPPGPAADLLAPVTTVALTPGPNASGWERQQVTVQLTASDNLGGSGINTTYFAVDNSACAPPSSGMTVPSTCHAGNSLTVTGDGKHTVYFFSVDKAGTFESQRQIPVRMDTTPPSCSASASPGSLWPPNHKLVPITVRVTTQDATSGVASYVLSSLTTNEGAIADEMTGFTIGQASTSGQLLADRDGNGKGRVYTLTYTVTDVAGNTATCAATITVPHDQGQ